MNGFDTFEEVAQDTAVVDDMRDCAAGGGAVAIRVGGTAFEMAVLDPVDPDTRVIADLSTDGSS